MATTRHENTSNPADNWTETTEGQTPNSVTLTTNAKGAAQVEIKLTYTTPAELIERASGDFDQLLTRLRAMLAFQGIPLAGEGGK